MRWLAYLNRLLYFVLSASSYRLFQELATSTIAL